MLRDDRGIAVLISILLVGVILSITLTLTAIFIPKVKSSAEIKNSSGAAFAAESLIEWCLYINRRSPASGTIPQPVMSNGATYINGRTSAAFTEADCTNPPIRSIGTYRGVTRSFEISF